MTYEEQEQAIQRQLDALDQFTKKLLKSKTAARNYLLKAGIIKPGDLPKKK